MAASWPPGELPVHVRRVLSGLGVDPHDVRALLGPASAHAAPRAFRVETGDGRLLKARTATSARAAARATALAGRLADPRVPVPVAQVGRVTVERWVRGETLGTERPRPEHLIGAAELLAWVHGFRGRPSEGLPHTRRTLGLLARAADELAALARLGLLDGATCAGASALLARDVPPSSWWGLAHGDLCGANLVAEPGGRVVSIDNEQVRRGFQDYDLARAWYRWPLSATAQRRFDERYDAATGRPPDPVARRAWRVVASLHGVHVRLRLGTSPAGALARLGTALTDAGAPSAGR